MNRFFKIFRDEGFTQVSVLLGVVLAFGLIAMLSYAPKMMRPAAPKPVSDAPLQEAIQDALRAFVRTKLVHTAVPCGDPVEFFQSHSFLRTYTGSVGQMKADPPAGLSARAWEDLFQGSMAAKSFAGAALSRCPLTVLGTGGRFHFCLRDGFMKPPLNFAEVSIQLVDRRTGKPLSCSQYLEPGRTSAGAVVDYLLFSIQDKGEELEVTRKRANFSVVR